MMITVEQAVEAVKRCSREMLLGQVEVIVDALRALPPAEPTAEEDNHVILCSGDWVSGSGGHRGHDPCTNKATWTHPADLFAYCDEHVPDRNVHHGYIRTGEITVGRLRELSGILRSITKALPSLAQPAEPTAEDVERVAGVVFCTCHPVTKDHAIEVAKAILAAMRGGR